MPNLQHSPRAKNEATEEEPHPQGASSIPVSTGENEDFFVQKGNKIVLRLGFSPMRTLSSINILTTTSKG